MAQGIHSWLGPVALDALAELASIRQFISLVMIAIASTIAPRRGRRTRHRAAHAFGRFDSEAAGPDP